MELKGDTSSVLYFLAWDERCYIFYLKIDYINFTPGKSSICRCVFAGLKFISSQFSTGQRFWNWIPVDNYGNFKIKYKIFQHFLILIKTSNTFRICRSETGFSQTREDLVKKVDINRHWTPHWSRGQLVWWLTIRSRVRFPILPQF